MILFANSRFRHLSNQNLDQMNQMKVVLGRKEKEITGLKQQLDLHRQEVSSLRESLSGETESVAGQTERVRDLEREAATAGLKAPDDDWT